MNIPDAELDIKRDEEGRVVGFSYKVHNEGKDGKRSMECLEILRMCVMAAFDAEGPEDHSVQVDIPVTFPSFGS